MTIIEVDIIFDFVCAWCYIGKRQLEMAISLYQKTYPGGKSDTFTINWRPYYLNYGPSTHSVNKSEVADVKLADMNTEQREKLYQRMNQIGRSVGINFKKCTKEPEVLNSVVEGIFHVYHELEKDISNKEVLREIAVNSGIAAVEVDEWLDSGEQVKVVDDQAEKNKEFLAGAGVPNYTVQGERLDGQPDAEDFMEAFIKAKTES
ncbi:hypothetical protein CEP52_006346 [Fusarium oligoseptatum]|uniref:DSBA-like thioredoxin domain-containing protein n=1 Tax=Fusarium oligoseptatum TaxID=2604345 RepID=A0A428TTI3_9HYPO|nr:hypothetical protein CEP52_006346 [Fusarium oligoseptatum]